MRSAACVLSHKRERTPGGVDLCACDCLWAWDDHTATLPHVNEGSALPALGRCRKMPGRLRGQAPASSSASKPGAGTPFELQFEMGSAQMHCLCPGEATAIVSIPVSLVVERMLVPSPHH